MAAGHNESSRHALEITFFDLPATASIRLDLPLEAGAEILISPAMPAICLGASYGGGEMGIQGISLTPRRLQFQVEGAPSTLPLRVSVGSADAFIHGWLQVPEGVQTRIASAAEQIRFVGPGYWAVPLVQTARAESPAPAASPAKPAPPPPPASGAKSTAKPAPPPPPAPASEAAASSVSSAAAPASPPAPTRA